MRRLLAGVCALAVMTPAAQASTGYTTQVSGAGPDVILIPGLASGRAVWADEVARLKDRYRVRVVEIDGFAGAAAAGEDPAIMRTVADRLCREITDRDLGRPAVIGHSMGGEIALMMAAMPGCGVGRVMVVDALPFFPLIFDPDATVASVTPRAEKMRDAMLAEDQASYVAGAPATVAHMAKTSAGVAAAGAGAAASDHATVARALYEDMTTDLRPELPRIGVPVTVLYAWDAAYGVPRDAVDGLYARAYAGLPDKTLKRVDDSFHFVMYDQPEVLAVAIEAFLGAGAAP